MCQANKHYNYSFHHLPTLKTYPLILALLLLSCHSNKKDEAVLLNENWPLTDKDSFNFTFKFPSSEGPDTSKGWICGTGLHGKEDQELFSKLLNEQVLRNEAALKKLHRRTSSK